MTLCHPRYRDRVIMYVFSTDGPFTAGGTGWRKLSTDTARDLLNWRMSH